MKAIACSILTIGVLMSMCDYELSEKQRRFRQGLCCLALGATIFFLAAE